MYQPKTYAYYPKRLLILIFAVYGVRKLLMTKSFRITASKQDYCPTGNFF